MTDSMLVSEASARWIFAAVGAICVGLLCFAYYLQHGPGLQQPCPLCILQRYAYLAIALVALAAAFFGPNRSGSLLIAGVLDLFATAGIALAFWQVGKGESMIGCLGDPVGDFVYRLPMRAWWPEYLAAYGGCADKHPPILGLSAPIWSLVWFAAFSAVLTFLMFTLARKKA